mmetsp:Transcript_76746/g.213280  ORF Transcript_76746/g.213280 Transcript_76746/m.213280 type:complete len:206 (+) Transcript_76746:260-877(+)
MPCFMSSQFFRLNIAMILLPSRFASLLDIATCVAAGELESMSGVRRSPSAFRPPAAPGASGSRRVPRCLKMCATPLCAATAPLGRRKSPVSVKSTLSKPKTRITSANSSSSSHSTTSTSESESSSSLSPPSSSSSSSSSWMSSDPPTWPAASPAPCCAASPAAPTSPSSPSSSTFGSGLGSFLRRTASFSCSMAKCSLRSAMPSL